MIDTQVIQKIKTTLWLLPVAVCIDMQVDVNYYNMIISYIKIYFIMSLAISYHIHTLQKQVRRPLICCCMLYVAAMGI